MIHEPVKERFFQMNEQGVDRWYPHLEDRTSNKDKRIQGSQVVRAAG